VRSHSEAALRILLVTLLLTAVSGVARAQDPSGRTDAGRPTQADIDSAIKAVKADPNLATERTIQMLRWKDAGAQKAEKTPSWMTWLGGFFGWVTRSARVLMWCVIVALAAMLAVYIVRIVHTRGEAGYDDPFVAPTHVMDLDIRPETLPADIGAAARLLWDRGDHRAALALLYRGLLSRLAHVHRVPIRDSSTEGDCLGLAAMHLTQERLDYVSRLVQTWQRSVYGREDVHASAVYVLCDDFARALDAAVRFDAAAQEGAS
jgi:hypothetical protein